MNEMQKIYSGPSIVENYALLFNNHPNRNREEDILINRFIGFSLPDKIFYLKLSHLNADFSEHFIGKAIITFTEKLTEKEKEINPNAYGFSIMAGTKKFLIFVETKELYEKWIRILSFYFFKIDVENRYVGVLKGFISNGIDRDINLFGYYSALNNLQVGSDSKLEAKVYLQENKNLQQNNYSNINQLKNTNMKNNENTFNNEKVIILNVSSEIDNINLNNATTQYNNDKNKVFKSNKTDFNYTSNDNIENFNENFNSEYYQNNIKSATMKVERKGNNIFNYNNSNIISNNPNINILESVSIPRLENLNISNNHLYRTNGGSDKQVTAYYSNKTDYPNTVKTNFLAEDIRKFKVNPGSIENKTTLAKASSDLIEKISYNNAPETNFNRSYRETTKNIFNTISFNENLNNNSNNKAEPLNKESKQQNIKIINENFINNNVNDDQFKFDYIPEEKAFVDSDHVPNFGTKIIKNACYEKGFLVSDNELKGDTKEEKYEGRERFDNKGTKNARLNNLNKSSDDFNFNSKAENAEVEDLKLKKHSLSPIEHRGKNHHFFNNDLDFNFNDIEQTTYDTVKNLYKNTYINDFYTSKKLNSKKDKTNQENFEKSKTFNKTQVLLKNNIINVNTQDKTSPKEKHQNYKNLINLEEKQNAADDKDHLKKYEIDHETNKPKILYLFEEDTNFLDNQNPNKNHNNGMRAQENLRNIGNFNFLNIWIFT